MAAPAPRIRYQPCCTNAENPMMMRVGSGMSFPSTWKIGAKRGITNAVRNPMATAIMNRTMSG